MNLPDKLENKKILPQRTQRPQRKTKWLNVNIAFLQHMQRKSFLKSALSVPSVLSDITTSHSTRLAKNANQVAGYVAN